MASPYTDLNRPPLSQIALRRALLVPGGLWTDLRVVAETGSTNADLVAEARAGAGDGTVLIAERQHTGRGRLGRQWLAPPRAGLTFSVLLRPGLPAARLGWLPLLAGVAVAEAVGRVTLVDATLKWPNDLLVPDSAGEAKCAGLLAEAVPDGECPPVVVGVGLNVSQRRDELPTPPDGALPPTSLALVDAQNFELHATIDQGPLGRRAPGAPEASRVALDRDPILRAVLRRFAERYVVWRDAGGDPDAGGLGVAYRERCATLGRQVRIQLPGGDSVSGVASDVDSEGRLAVRVSPNELRFIAAGDVIHVR